jgi:hypothetical protein
MYADKRKTILDALYVNLTKKIAQLLLLLKIASPHACQCINCAMRHLCILTVWSWAAQRRFGGSKGNGVALRNDFPFSIWCALLRQSIESLVHEFYNIPGTLHWQELLKFFKRVSGRKENPVTWEWMLLLAIFPFRNYGGEN